MADELKKRNVRRLLADYLGMTIALVVLVVIFGLSADHFFTLTTFRTIANQIPDITIAAVGMTFVLIIAGIDLSVGSVMALAGAVLGIARGQLGSAPAAARWSCACSSALPAGRPTA